MSALVEHISPCPLERLHLRQKDGLTHTTRSMTAHTSLEHQALGTRAIALNSFDGASEVRLSPEATVLTTLRQALPSADVLTNS